MPERNLPLMIFVSFLAMSWSQAGDAPNRYTETVRTEWGEEISFEMALIPASSFRMGNDSQEEGKSKDEGPAVEVRLTPYYLATTEVTLQLFLAYYRETHAPADDYFASDSEEVDTITGPTPVYGDMTMGHDLQHPAIGMTWKNAVTFCRWLSQKTGREYRLPTEAEWENACRGGTDQPFHVGGEEEELAEYAWFKAGSPAGLHEVATKKASRFGLYDMLGNVQEWVYDFYSADAYLEAAKENPSFNPRGPETGRVHVSRGGSHRSPAREIRCTARDYERRWWRSGDPQLPKSLWWLPDMDHIGFRVARSVTTE